MLLDPLRHIVALQNENQRLKKFALFNETASLHYSGLCVRTLDRFLNSNSSFSGKNQEKDGGSDVTDVNISFLSS